jgi:hypothetical protein
MKTHLIIFMLFVAAVAHAQDPMAKWKPNVGDKFTYERLKSGGSYTPGEHRDTGSYRDTIVMEIVQSDTMYDSTHSVVAVEGGPHRYYYYHPGHDSVSNHSFGIITYPFDYSQNGFGFDFSNGADSQVVVGSHRLTAYRDFVERGVMMAATNSQTALYSPELRWFTYFDNSTYGIEGPSDLTIDQFESETLIFASSLGVYEPPGPSNNDFSICISGALMQISILKFEASHVSLDLLDPLGRPVRSWQLAASDGPREITLNVADVPSGVYFVRLQGGGVDEVKRVAIIH